MNIEIKEPCHENWQAMTPNQQGAFCQVCQKDVIDFSKKSINQIKSFFTEKKNEKICGRFEKKQLAYLSFDDFFASFKYWVLSKKFAVIFFFTFGFMTLDASAQSSGHKKGKVVAPKETYMMLGGPTVATPPEHLQGAVAYQPDTLKKNNQTKTVGKIKCTNPPKETKRKKQAPPVMGIIAMPPKQDEKNAK